MTRDQKELCHHLRREIADLEGQIKRLKSQCKHEIKVHRTYNDYDRNGHEVICPDCGDILFDGNVYDWQAFKIEHPDYKYEENRR